MRLKPLMIGFAITTCFCANIASASDFKLQSTDIAEGQQLTSSHVFQGFGCEGGNVSPQLSWSNAPSETKSFAITVYDPDAPTGSGWWHWTLVNLPASVTSLPKGVKLDDDAFKGAMNITNDYGVKGFGGACPPVGEVHRYQFTVHALGIEKIELPENPSSALAGFMIHANSLASDTITAVYTRQK